MSMGTKMVRKYNWNIIYFFAGVTLVALVGGPWYFWRYGISLPVALITLFFVVVTGMSITVGYHRLFAHSTFKAHPVIQFLILFFGAAAFEQSALTWSSGHRDHHRYVDTERDPYSIKKGFWYAHVGWMTLWCQEPDYTNAKDLMKDKLLMHQHRYYPLWGLTAGILLPVLMGALVGQALGAFVFAVGVRLAFVYNATFCINSVCHTFGRSTYDIYSTAKDNWVTALVTNGEGYHNFHHRFPTDYRNGVRWYHWDPSKWAIALLARTGLAWGLKRVSTFTIIEARIAAENQAIHDRLVKIADDRRIVRVKEVLQAQHALLLERLSAWESSVKTYQSWLKTRNAGEAAAVPTLEQIQLKRSAFQQTRREWSDLTKSWTSALQAA